MRLSIKTRIHTGPRKVNQIAKANRAKCRHIDLRQQKAKILRLLRSFWLPWLPRLPWLLGRLELLGSFYSQWAAGKASKEKIMLNRVESMWEEVGHLAYGYVADRGLWFSGPSRATIALQLAPFQHFPSVAPLVVNYPTPLQVKAVRRWPAHRRQFCDPFVWRVSANGKEALINLAHAEQRGAYVTSNRI